MTDIMPFQKGNFYYKGGVFPAGIYRADFGSANFRLRAREILALKDYLQTGEMDNFLEYIANETGTADLFFSVAMSQVKGYECALKNGYSLTDVAILTKMAYPVDSHDGCLCMGKKETLFFDNRLISDGVYFPLNGNLVIRNIIQIISEKYNLAEANPSMLPQLENSHLPSEAQDLFSVFPGPYEYAAYSNGKMSLLHMGDTTASDDASEVLHIISGLSELLFLKGKEWGDSVVYYTVPGKFELPRQIFRAGHSIGQYFDSWKTFKDEKGRFSYGFCYKNNCQENFFVLYPLVELIENVLAFSIQDQLPGPRNVPA